MFTPDKTPDSNLMDAYRQQMLDMYRQATPSSPPPTAEDNWLDTHYPEPNISQDKAALAASAIPSPQNTPAPAPTAPAAYVGYLRVFAFSGGGAEPIMGARVIVTRPEEEAQTVYANVTTDRDGFTPVIALPSVDPALSLRPGDALPYVTYTIRITADGFQPTEHQNVPVYGNNYVTQPAAMIPLLPGEENSDTQMFLSGGPTNL